MTMISKFGSEVSLWIRLAVVQQMAAEIPAGSIHSSSYYVINLTHCAVIKPWQLHIEINAASQVHISPTKQNICSPHHVVKHERDKTVEVLASLLGKRIPSTFAAFEEYFQSILTKNLMDGHNSGEPSKHLTPDHLLRIAYGCGGQHNVCSDLNS